MVDLHTHSAASDGSDTPSELVALAAGTGLAGIALTDHDTVSGIPEFLEAAAGKSIRAVPGLEISSTLFNREIHILGLFIDHASEKLADFLKEARKNRNARNTLILQKLNAMHYEITQRELDECAGGESVGRPHFAKILVEKGYFQTPQEVFDRCLKRGGRAYVPRVLPSPRESIGAIHEAGGLAIWAHPVSGQSGERGFARKMLRKLIPAGLDGVEVRYSMFSEHQTSMMNELAEAEGILKSGGSDFHGTHQPTIDLGCGCGNLAVPFEYLEKMREALAAGKGTAQ